MKSRIESTNSSTIVSIEGHVDEKSSMPNLNANTSGDILLDLSKVQSISSLGIQKWLDWVTAFPRKANIYLLNCPPCIILQVNMVDNFLPENAKVRSLLVPFFCTECDKEFSEKYVVGTDISFDGISVNINKKVTQACDSGECAIEQDINPEKYFKFLKN